MASEFNVEKIVIWGVEEVDTDRLRRFITAQGLPEPTRISEPIPGAARCVVFPEGTDLKAAYDAISGKRIGNYRPRPLISHPADKPLPPPPTGWARYLTAKR